jgi:hypothetical protein
MDVQQFFADFQDYLAPKLDTYEQAIYLYVFRHSRLIGLDEVVIGFKSARHRMAFGVGTRDTFMSESTCYEKVRSLAEKRCINVVSSEQTGTRLRLRLPSEIEGMIPAPIDRVAVDIEQMDFFETAEHRQLIFAREAHRNPKQIRNAKSARNSKGVKGALTGAAVTAETKEHESTEGTESGG